MTENLPVLLTFYGAVRNALELLGALSIVVGALLTLWNVLKPMLQGEHVNVTNSRFQLSRYLTLALEFQLSSDVLGTAIAPTWTAIGKLAAIGTIRTALNYVLTREMKDERPQLGVPASESVKLPGRRDATSSDE